MGKQITDYLLYRWRYILGYTLIGLTVLGLLLVAMLYIPGGISQSEMSSVVTSNAISFSLSSFDPGNIINLPYHLFQKLSISMFGLSNVSIKLPSFILGLLSAFGMLILLRMWFRQNVAVLTTILVITTGQFLFIAQNGTPSIVYLLGPIWLLVSAMMVSRKAKWSGAWKLLLFGIAALSLYTPLSIYILIALLSAVLLHPHLRYLVRQLSKVKILIASICALILTAPLMYVVVLHPSVGVTLLGIPEQWPNFADNLLQLLRQYFDFISTNSGSPMAPIYGLGSMILICLGIFRLATTKYTARSYIICIWIILLVPILAINPSFVSVTFVPVVLLMAMGISTLITNWYTLFPRNPYARFAGLLPLAVLIASMVMSGIDRYAYGYLYSPQTASEFSDDLRLLNKQLDGPSKDATVMLVSEAEVPFYSVVARQYSAVTVATTPTALPSTTKTIIVGSSMHPTINNLGEPARIITSSTTHSSDRFYLYKINGE